MSKKSQSADNGLEPAISSSVPRLYWGRLYENVPEVEFVGSHLESYNDFLGNGIDNLISEISPVDDFTGKNWSLSLGSHVFGAPKLTPAVCLEKGLTYHMPLKVQAILTNKQTGEKVNQEVFMGDVPVMTSYGTFVINGIERCVINQLVRSPGVYFMGDVDPTTGRTLYFAEVRPLRGCWLEFQVSRGNVVSVRIDRRRKFPVTTFLRALGFGSNEEILKALAPVIDAHPEATSLIEATLKKDATHGSAEATIEIYKKMRPGEPAVLETAQEFIKNLFFNNRRYNLGKVGRYKINKRLGIVSSNTEENWVLTKEDILETVKYLMLLQVGVGEIDDIDHLANRRLRRVGELVGQAAFRVGLLRLERAIKERMSMLDVKAGRAQPNQVVNARPIISAINEFFRTSQLSSILDQTNPLSEVDNLRKLSVMGTGGISRERASFSIRDINASQYSRICPVKSPEGPNIGLVTFLSLYAKIDEYGFLLAPYRKVVKDKNGRVRMGSEIVYLAADDERNHKMTYAALNLDKDDYLLDERIPVRYKGEFIEVAASEVEYMDVTPQQVVGSAAALIPFLAHDDGIRALMGSNMQAQAVPLVSPQSPVVGTGIEGAIAGAMGWLTKSEHNGVVEYADANKVVVKTDKGEKFTYQTSKFKRTNPNGTCYNQKVIVKTGDKVKKGQLIIDGPATVNGELSLGTNLTIAYMHYDGYGYEDAIVISDRVVKDDALTSIHIEEYSAEVVDTKLGPEELTRDIPNVGEMELANLDESGIVVVGTEVGPNDILVGKIQPKGETELSAEERLLRAIFGEKAREVRDTSLRMPHGEFGTVIDVQVLDKEKGDELTPGVNKLVKVRVAEIRKIEVGDKVKGRHGNKGIISKIVPAADMPYLANGQPVDIIISPLSVLGRMNLGQILEAHLGWAMKRTGQKVAVPVFEPISESKIIQSLEAAGLPSDGKVTVYDGRTGLPFEQKVVVGISYILKLHHMVEDKIHARSTGPYSLVTQQPLGGKARMGGQRLGEMEVWALEAHKAAFTLQEMLTIKSDDIVGRAKAFEAIVKGVDIAQTTVPESFKVLVKELQSLGLNIVPVGTIQVQTPPPTVDENTEKIAKQLEEELEATSIATDDIKSEGPMEIEETQ